jgi:hypothetical protein
MKKIAICGSMVFFDQMSELRDQLLQIGVEAWLPEEEERRVSLDDLEEAEVVRLKSRYITAHLKKIKESDAVLVANYAKNGIIGYIGSNTLMQMAFALAFDKPIYVLFEPGPQACKEEFLGLGTFVIDGNLNSICI